ncbi:Fe-S cluster assembly sulfur transfer protein SufU [Neoactinobaculum massilliense]|uniref:Fe-S cluster assembly sulfur transfer protein SufU n=1 Tax=Neoactinobaculum massilliense TaxID=2364794 RepID=UPI000F52140C|nr:SUF system NifU family Fe-S cluster assembly protein [Neoactinobaculum massilliense]
MSDMDEMYQAIILDAARERSGEEDLADAEGESFQMNPVCGDRITVKVKLSKDGSRVEKLGWQGDGCSISQASIGIMHDLVEGRSIDELADLYATFRELMDSRGHDLTAEKMSALEDAAAFEGVAKFPMRIKCALLGWMAVRDATDQALARRERGDE